MSDSLLVFFVIALHGVQYDEEVFSLPPLFSGSFCSVL